MKAGFIGLGTMGAGMAVNLQTGIQKDGHTVLVHDVRREAAASHIGNGAAWADSPAALARALNVPMRLANLALADLSEGLNRGWGQRDSRAIMALQTERAGVTVKVDPQRLTQALENKGKTG